MRGVLVGILALATLAGYVSAAQGNRHPADRTIEITRQDGKLVFVERGKKKAGVVTVVVGQTVRWENRDDQEHRLVSEIKPGGRPVLDTGVIGRGEWKDVVIDFDLYRRAGGRPANFVRLKYHSTSRPDDPGELDVLSAARRSVGLP